MFLLDENVDIRLINFLQKSKYSAISIPKGLKNGDVIALAKKEKAILMTNDKDFLDLSKYSNNCGIIVFNIHPPMIEKYLQSVNNLLSKVNLSKIENKIILAQENNITELS